MFAAAAFEHKLLKLRMCQAPNHCGNKSSDSWIVEINKAGSKRVDAVAHSLLCAMETSNTQSNGSLLANDLT